MYHLCNVCVLLMCCFLLQCAVMPAEQYELALAASMATYHTFCDIPEEAFPLFLSAKVRCFPSSPPLPA